MWKNAARSALMNGRFSIGSSISGRSSKRWRTRFRKIAWQKSSAEDGYRTLTLELQHPAAAYKTPFPGEAVADVEGRHFNAMLFTRDTTLMLELIWGTEWPGRLPTTEELRPVWSEATSSDD